jgi:signal transduction histidine kinase/ligand-binding sensor domain-containing protein
MSLERAGRGIPSPSRLVGWSAILIIATCVWCASALGQTPATGNVQVGHDTWTFKEGAPADVVALAQTKDGFLWLGSSEGLFRFDGTRFEPYSSPFGDRLLSSNIYSLFAPLSGGLWIGYTSSGGFSFLDKGRMTTYPIETGTVIRFAQNRDGIVWAITNAGLWRFDRSAWQHVGLEWNAPSGHMMDLGFDSEGTLWALVGNFGAPKQLIYLTPGTRHFKTAASNLAVEVFTWRPDRTVLTTPMAPGTAGAGQGSAEEPFAAYPITSKNLQIVDRNNSVWVSPTGTTVVVRVPNANLVDDPNIVSLAGSETYDINPYRMAELVDREGNIWFGDSRGLHRLFYTPFIKQKLPSDTLGSDFAAVGDEEGAVWISFNSGNTLEADLFHVVGSKVERRLPQVTSSFAYRAPDKTFWFSGNGCLWHLVGQDFIRVSLPPETVNQSEFLQTIAEDPQGGVWVSFGRGGLYRLANATWTPFAGRTDLPKTGRIMVAFTDSLGRVWFGNVNGLLAVLDGDRVRVYRPGDELQVGNITAIYGRGPKIWVGGEFGLEQFDEGRFHKIAALDDQWLHGITGIVETREGDLWINAISGIFHIRKAEISEAVKNPAYRVKGEHFDRREGLSGIPSQVHPLTTAIEGSDGRLWFTLRNEVVWLDPKAYSEKRTVPPPITIQSISADDKGYTPDSRLSFPAHTSSVQISYTAVSLSDPEAIRFRYKLQEMDKDWHEAVAATPVTYRNLPPGSYHFSVEASDTNGVWSGQPANGAFAMLPAFYQTLWFRSLCVLLILATLAGLYQLRLRQLAQQYSLRLEERVSERTRIARELHDTLLQSFQGLLLRFQTAYALFETRPAEAKEVLARSIDQTARAITEGREAVQGLRASTLERNDLANAITTLGGEIMAETGGNATVGLQVDVEGAPRSLHPIVRDEIYRIASEALRNAFRYGDATQIEVELRYDDRQFRLRVRDNGKGIDSNLVAEGRAGHFGLHGMRERAKLIGGKLTVWTAPYSGTEIELNVPASHAYANSGSSSLTERFSGKSAQSTS